MAAATSPILPEDAPRAMLVSRSAARPAVRPFAGILDPVIVEDPIRFTFAGSISRRHAQAIWIWMARDLGADLLDLNRVEAASLEPGDFEPAIPQLLIRAREAVLAVKSNPEAERRLHSHLGGEEGYERLPVVLNALRGRALLDKAQSFGRASNAIAEESALATALQSMPLHDPALAALLFHAAIGQTTNPTKTVGAVLRVAGSEQEAAVLRVGFGPLIDAILAHAQNQLFPMQPMGSYADIDLTCRAIERFHRLIRSIAAFIELSRNSRWGQIMGILTRQVSERIEPRLRTVVSDINQGLRQGREGADRLDTDRLLAGLNGCYLLAAVRGARDSLALNAMAEQAWVQSGQVIEMNITRNLDLLRQSPGDAIIAGRTDLGIKMAEVRFGAEYAQTLRRARAGVDRRN